MKLIKTKKIKGKIKVLTGLHIGGGNEAVEIGGMDNPIIRNPLTGEPYIPGSTIKGKMRSLMEWKNNKLFSDISKSGDPCKCGDVNCPICRVFGAGIDKNNLNKALKRGPTRIVVNDAFLTQEWRDNYINGDQLVEEKHENSINRITAEANPRSLERVVPGVEFEFSLSFKVLEMDNSDNSVEKKDEDLFKEVVLSALKMIEEYDYLGGGGSRGSGKIKFIDLTDETGKNVDLSEIKI